MTPLRTLPRTLRQRGVAAIEAALILPVLVFMLIAAVEMYAYLRTATVLSRASYTLADLLAEAPNLQYPGDCNLAESLCTLWPLAQTLAHPAEFPRYGALRVAIYGADTGPENDPGVRGEPSTWTLPAVWQFQAAAPEGSTLATAHPDHGPSATVGDVLIVVQTAVDYQPVLVTPGLWSTLAGAPRIERVAYAHGRPSLIPALP